jgi:hypothetical protein
MHGIAIKNKHKLLSFLKELANINFSEVIIIIKGEDNYGKFKEIFDRHNFKQNDNTHRRRGHGKKTSK